MRGDHIPEERSNYRHYGPCSVDRYGSLGGSLLTRIGVGQGDWVDPTSKTSMLMACTGSETVGREPELWLI